MPFTDKEDITARTALAEKKLYKFRSFSDDIQQSRVKDILLNHRIRFSRPSELNDPIEGKPIYCLGDWNSSEYRKQFEEYVWNILQHNSNKPPKEKFLARIRTLTKEQLEEGIQEIVAANQAEIEGKWRVLSLSAAPNQELMWSHYSDSHKGIALVFDASGDEFGSAFKIEYVRERKPLDITTENPSNVLYTTILTKRSAWAYEEEYRCIAAESWEPPFSPLSEQFLYFSPARLLGVVFGSNMATNDKQTIVAWASKRPTPLQFWHAKISIAGDVVIDPNVP